MARNARQSYQKTARWMLAAFATVGVLIFGSLPFAAIADVELTWPDSLWLIGGLRTRGGGNRGRGDRRVPGERAGGRQPG